MWFQTFNFSYNLRATKYAPDYMLFRRRESNMGPAQGSVSVQATCQQDTQQLNPTSFDVPSSSLTMFDNLRILHCQC